MATRARIVGDYYVTSDGRISHFTEKEFYRGANWLEKPNLPQVEEALIDIAEGLREDVKRSVFVTSGVRSQKANAKAGGDPQSLHLTGGAVDFDVDGMRGWEIVPALERVTVGGSTGRWGIYHRNSNGHIHLDTDRVRERRRFVVDAGVYIDLEEWCEAHFPGVKISKISTVAANKVLGF